MGRTVVLRGAKRSPAVDVSLLDRERTTVNALATGVGAATFPVPVTGDSASRTDMSPEEPRLARGTDPTLRVLVAVPIPLQRSLVQFFMQEAGFELLPIPLPNVNVAKVAAHDHPDAIVLHESVAKPWDSGLVSDVRRESPSTRVVVLAQAPDEASAGPARGADAYLEEWVGDRGARRCPARPLSRRVDPARRSVCSDDGNRSRRPPRHGASRTGDPEASRLRLMSKGRWLRTSGYRAPPRPQSSSSRCYESRDVSGDGLHPRTGWRCERGSRRRLQILRSAGSRPPKWLAVRSSGR